MSKKPNFEGMSFRVNFITDGGQLLLRSEWSTERDAVIHLVDSLNREKKGIRAQIESKGTGYVALPQNMPHIR